MAADPQRWLNLCVRLDGYVESNRFYSDVAGYYSYLARDYADRRNDGWLGLYPRRRYGFRGPMRSGKVLGVVHDCETDHARAEAESPDTFVMLLGFCHYRYGLVLRRASFLPEARAEFERQMGGEARRRFGDLEAPSEAGPIPPQVQELVARFLAAARAADEAALRVLVEFWGEDEPEDAPRRAAARAAFLRGDGDSALASLRGGPEVPPVAYFRERSARHIRSPDEPGEWHACICRVDDCSGLWPVSRFDATADPSRPYLCVAAYPEIGRTTYERLGIFRDGSYPIEPQRTAFRRQSESSRR